MGLFRAFNRTPQKGLPLSMKGIAEGLRKMARAWETLQIKGGSITWNNGTPTIDVQGGQYSGGEGEPFEHPFRVYWDGSDYKIKPGNIHIYWGGSFTTCGAGGGTLSASAGDYVYLDVNLSGPSASIGVNSSGRQVGESDASHRYYDIAILNDPIEQLICQEIYETMGS